MDNKITWTKDELKEFDSLIDKVSSKSQMDWIEGRIDMKKFVEKHGKEKCNAMYVHLGGKARTDGPEYSNDDPR